MLKCLELYYQLNPIRIQDCSIQPSVTLFHSAVLRISLLRCQIPFHKSFKTDFRKCSISKWASKHTGHMKATPVWGSTELNVIKEGNLSPCWQNVLGCWKCLDVCCVSCFKNKNVVSIWKMTLLSQISNPRTKRWSHASCFIDNHDSNWTTCLTATNKRKPFSGSWCCF